MPTLAPIEEIGIDPSYWREVDECFRRAEIEIEEMRLREMKPPKIIWGDPRRNIRIISLAWSVMPQVLAGIALDMATQCLIQELTAPDEELDRRKRRKKRNMLCMADCLRITKEASDYFVKEGYMKNRALKTEPEYRKDRKFSSRK